jgi:hypothetical protein
MATGSQANLAILNSVDRMTFNADVSSNSSLSQP